MYENSSFDFHEDPMVISYLSPEQSMSGQHTPDIIQEDGGGSNQRLAASGGLHSRKQLNFSHFSNAAMQASQSVFSKQPARNIENLSGQLRTQLRSHNTISSPRNASNGNNFNTGGNSPFFVRKTKKHKKSKISFFSTIKWKQFALKWMSHTSFSRFKKLSMHQFILLSDKASSLFKSSSQLKHSITLEEEENKMAALKLHSFQGNFIELLLNLKQFEWCNIELQWLPVFSPTGTFRFAWDLVILVVIIALMYMIPVAICFNVPLQQMFNQGFLLACNLILIVDIILAWNFGYFEKGLPIMNRSQIVRNYLFNGFLIDIISSTVLALDLFFTNGVALNILHLLFFIKISSINGIFKKIEERFHLTPKVTQISSLIQLLFLIVTVTHLFACMWVAVSQYESNAGQNSWIQKMNFDGEDWVAQYVCSYYFSTVTMITVGYGDFVPVNNAERMIGIVAMLISCVVFAYSLNAIGEIFSTIAQKRRQVQADLFLINNFMTKKNIDEKLQYEVREFLEYSWQMASDRNPDKEAIILNQLNPQLKEKLLVETFQMVIKRYDPFRKNFSEGFVLSLADIIEESSFRPDQWITKQEIEGKNSDDLFFLETGKAVVCEEDNTEKQIHVLSVGESFGDLSFFSGQPHELNVKAIEYTTVLRIRRTRGFLSNQHPMLLVLFQNTLVSIVSLHSLRSTASKAIFVINDSSYSITLLSGGGGGQQLQIIKRFVRSEGSEREEKDRRSFRFPNLLLSTMVTESSLRFEAQNCDAVAQYIDQHLTINQEDCFETDEDDDDDDDDENDEDDVIEDQLNANDAVQEEETQQTTSKSADIPPSPSPHNQQLQQQQQQTSLFDQTFGPTKQSKIFLSQHSFSQQQQQILSDSSKISKPTLTNIPEIDSSDSTRLKSPMNRPVQFLGGLLQKSASTTTQPIKARKKAPKLSIIPQAPAVQQRRFDQATRASIILEGQLSQEASDVSVNQLEISKKDFGLHRMSSTFHPVQNGASNNNNKSVKLRQIVAEIASAFAEHQANNKEAEMYMSKASKETESFDEQRNFNFYLPQNNLSEILQFLRFKRRMLKSLRASSAKHSQPNNTELLIKSTQIIPTSTYVIQQPGMVSNYSLLRKYEQSNNLKQVGIFMKKQDLLRKKSMSIQSTTSRFQKLLTRFGEEAPEDTETGAITAAVTSRPASFFKEESTLDNYISRRLVESERLLEDGIRVKPSPFSMNRDRGTSIVEHGVQNTVSVLSIESQLPLSKCYKQYEIYMKRKKNPNVKQSNHTTNTNNQNNTSLASQLLSLDEVIGESSQEKEHLEDVSDVSRHNGGANQPARANTMKSPYAFDEFQVLYSSSINEQMGNNKVQKSECKPVSFNQTDD